MKQGSLFGIGKCLTICCLLMTLNYKVGVKWRYRKRCSIKHKKSCDWESWNDIWDNCGVLTLTKGKDEECEEITVENSGLIIG